MDWYYGTSEWPYLGALIRRDPCFTMGLMGVSDAEEAIKEYNRLRKERNELAHPSFPGFEERKGRIPLQRFCPPPATYAKHTDSDAKRVAYLRSQFRTFANISQKRKVTRHQMPTRKRMNDYTEEIVPKRAKMTPEAELREKAFAWARAMGIAP